MAWTPVKHKRKKPSRDGTSKDREWPPVAGELQHAVNRWVKKHGHQSITRILLNANCWRRAQELIAFDLGMSVKAFRPFFWSVCDRYKIGKSAHYVLKPDIRKHVNYLEHLRRSQFDETLRIERWILETSGNQALLAEYEDRIEMPNTYLTERFNGLRKRLGPVAFSAFLTDLGGDLPGSSVADKWKKHGITDAMVVLWRTVVTSQVRRLNPELEKLAHPPLSLVKVKGLSTVKVGKAPARTAAN